MAGWDKIRAAAQRPDCIFSAFPDGTDGAMYHPRSSADVVLIKTASNVQIANGAFEAPGTGSGYFYDTACHLGGRKHDLTLIAKFTADVPAGEHQYFVAPLICGGVGGNHWGIAYQGGKQTFDGTHFTLYPACGLSYTRTDTEASATFRPYVGKLTMTCGEWHTVALTIGIAEFSADGKFECYVDGENIFSRTLKSYFNDPSLLKPGTLETVLPNTATRVNEVIWYTGYTLKTKWAMAFNRILSAEEIKYLSEE